MKTVYRYEVPVDDKPHEIRLHGPYTFRVESRDSSTVEFWAEYHPGHAEIPVVFQVYGTGHQIPDDAIIVGTTQRVNGLVWHLYEIP